MGRNMSVVVRGGPCEWLEALVTLLPAGNPLGYVYLSSTRGGSVVWLESRVVVPSPGAGWSLSGQASQTVMARPL